MRLIDADAIEYKESKIDTVYRSTDGVYVWQEKRTFEWVSKETIDKMPTIEAEPIGHGKWIYREYKVSKGESIGYFVCSECGHTNWVKEDNYCSYCGTKMDEVEE